MTPEPKRRVSRGTYRPLFFPISLCDTASLAARTCLQGCRSRSFDREISASPYRQRITSLRCATRPATAIFAAARSSEPEGCVSGTSACEVYAREHAVGLAPPSLQTPTAATKLRERGWVRTVREVSKIGRGAARAPENFEREAQLRCRTGLRHRRHAIANVSLATPFVHIDLVRLLRAPPAKQCARSTSLPSTALAKLRVRCCADAAYSRSKFDR